jgi:hypothetical protein
MMEDIGPEFRGVAAIKAWSDREIFDVQVALEAIDSDNRDGETVITAKVDGILIEPVFPIRSFSCTPSCLKTTRSFDCDADWRAKPLVLSGQSKGG